MRRLLLRPALAVATAMTVVAAVAGCATSTVPGAMGVDPPRTPSTALPDNHAAADAEAHRLLALAPLPRGARTAHPSAGQRSQLPGSVPGVQSLVLLTRYVSVPMTLDAAITWLGVHRPAGLTASGTMGSGSDGATTGRALMWAARATRAWASSELHVAVARLSTASTLWQFQAQVVWLNPAPERDDRAGPRMRVTTTGGCPRTDRGVVGVTNPRDLGLRLLPPGVPSEALVCDYAGLNGSPAFSLRRTVHVDRDAAAHLAAAAERIDLAHTDGARISCPMDDGSAVVIAFRFPDRAQVDLWYAWTGCPWVANGIVGAAATLPVR